MKMLWGVATLFCMTALLISPAWSDDKGKGKKDEMKEAVEMAAAAKVTIDQAIKTASEKVSGKVIEAELEKEHGKLLWEVEIVTPENTLMEVHIDATTGAVIDIEDAVEKSGRFKRPRT